MKSFVLATYFLLTINSALNAQSVSNRIDSTDINRLLGNWKGTLTYIDYTSDKPFSLDIEMNVEAKGKNKWMLSYFFPGEPKANSKEMLSVSADGSKLNKEFVTYRKQISDTELEIVTEYESTDGNDRAPATIRHTYRLKSDSYQSIKEVRYHPKPEWKKRNEYYMIKK